MGLKEGRITKEYKKSDKATNPILSKLLFSSLLNVSCDLGNEKLRNCTED
jgi:hypothetical protein